MFDDCANAATYKARAQHRIPTESIVVQSHFVMYFVYFRSCMRATSKLHLPTSWDAASVGPYRQQPSSRILQVEFDMTTG